MIAGATLGETTMTAMSQPKPPPTRRAVRPIGLAALLVAVAIGPAACGSDDADGPPQLEEAGHAGVVEHDYRIPPGTGERLDAGEEVAILPPVLEAQVGETIRIVNDDDRGHVVGIFFVGAGETLSQTFTSPGVFSGSCTVHTDGEFTLKVTGGR
jgi:hypothetical protein